MSKVLCIDMNVEMVLPEGVETIDDIKRFMDDLFDLRRVDDTVDFESVHRLTETDQVRSAIKAINYRCPDWWLDFYPSRIKVWDVTVDPEDGGAIDWGEQVLDTYPDGMLP